MLSTFKLVVFDLDDTLYRERDFLHSGIKACNNYLGLPEICSTGLSEIDWISDLLKIAGMLNCESNRNMLLDVYRHHIPSINLRPGVIEVLEFLKNNNVECGLITDGRSISQRNKIEALGISDIFSKVIISEELGTEKPDINNYLPFDNGAQTTYIGDNILKDFLSPNKLNWDTIMLKDDGLNVHSQNVVVRQEYLPKRVVNSFYELI